jgi:hypothetical protein
MAARASIVGASFAAASAMALPQISSSAAKRLLLGHELCKPPMTVAMKSLL